jgi:hypothetical protein
VRDAVRCLFCAAAVIAGACDVGHPPARGFGSRQVLSDRSATAPHFNDDHSKLFFGRPTPGAPDGSSLIDLSSLDLASSMETPIATAVSYYFEGLGPTGRPSPLFIYSSDNTPGAATGLSTLTILEPDTGERTVIDRLGNSFACCDSTVGPMVMFRDGPPAGAMNAGSGVLFGSLWLGPYKQLREATGLAVSSYAYPEDKGLLVVAEPSSVFLGPPAFGVLRVGYDGTVVETVVPASMTKAEPILGQPMPATPLQSSSLDPGTGIQERCLPVPAGAPAGTSPRCFVTYRREVQGMNTVRFVHFLDEDRELIVPHSGRSLGSNTFDVLGTSLDHEELFMWVGLPSVDGGNPSLWTWNVLTGDVSNCLLPGDTSGNQIWLPSGGGFAIPTAQSDVNPFDASRSGQIVVKTFGDVACTTVSGPLISFDFAPTGSAMITLQRSATETAMNDLAVLDSPGATPRTLAGATSFWRTRYLDQSRALLWRFAPEGLGLSWIDPTQAAPVDNPIAEQLMTDPIVVSPGRLLIGHEFVTQDETGTLSVFDLDAGTSTLVSRSVSELAVAYVGNATASTSGDQGPSEIPIAYVVKGRNPSGQDGIWVASVPTAP